VLHTEQYRSAKEQKEKIKKNKKKGRKKPQRLQNVT
jgi:hypothetical protein